MKKYSFLGIFVLVMIAFLPTWVEAQNTIQPNTHVTATQAMEVGYNFMNTSTTKAHMTTDALIYTGQAVDSLSGDVTDCYYVFALQPKGFVIVAADERVDPILGYSYDNNFVVEGMPNHVRGWLANYERQIEAVAKSDLKADPAVQTKWSRLKSGQSMSSAKSVGTTVGPLLTTQWGQGWPYNAMCPLDSSSNERSLTGCVATAMGMIMHYWGYPTLGTGSHSYEPYGFPEQSVNYGSTIYDWANMPDELTDSSTQAEIDAVSTLLWHCGVSVNMWYGIYESGASEVAVPDAMILHFGYSDSMYFQMNYNSSMWVAQIKENLDMGYPLLYLGEDIDGGGHAFVCDGYDASDNLHINWGWDGSWNGYYAVGAFDVGGFAFNHNNHAIFNIVPKCEANTAYQIMLTNSFTEMGSVDGGGTYNCGDICTISATPIDGYRFEYWTSDGAFVSNNANYTFMVTEGRSFEAHFGVQTYEVEAKVDPVQGGDISGYTSYTPFYYDDGEFVGASNGFGSNEFYWGITISAEELSRMNVTSLTKVSLFDYGEHNGQIYVYQGDHNPPFCWMMTYVQDYSCTGSQTWLEIPLMNPVAIDTTRMLWIAFHNIGGNNVAAGSRNTGDSRGRWLNLDGTNTWEDASDYGWDITWMIRAFFQSDDSRNYAGKYWINEYAVGDTCTISVIPREGYFFVKWTEDGQVVSTDSTYTFIVNADRTLSAHFTTPCAINVSVDTGAGGTVGGGGTYYYGDSCTITATPMTAEGYQFYCWTEDGEPVSMDSSYTFLVTGDRNLVARFGLPLSVSVTAVPSAGGSVSGSGLYDYGDTCTVTAMASENYQFDYWTDGITVSKDSPYSFMVTSDKQWVAHFKQPSSTVIAMTNPRQAGLVVGSPNSVVLHYDNGVFCDVVGVIGYGTMYFGIMFPADSLKGMNNMNLTKVSVYDAVPYMATVAIFEGGDNAPDSLVYQQDFSCVGTGGFIEVPLAQPVEIDTTKNLWITLHNYNGVQTAGMPAQFSGAICNNTGNRNGNWMSNDGIGWGELTQYWYDDNGNFVVNHNTWMIRGIVESAMPNTSVSCSGSFWGGESINGQTISLTAVPEPGSTFLNWTEFGEVVSTDPTYSFVVQGDRNLRANFSCTVTTVPDSEGRGSVSGGGVFLSGDTCTIVATANEGYNFLYWELNGERVSYDSVYTFSVERSGVWVARFAESACSINIDISWSYIYGEISLLVTYDDVYTERLSSKDVEFINGQPCRYKRNVADGTHISISCDEDYWTKIIGFRIRDAEENLVYEMNHLYDGYNFGFVFNCDGSITHNVTVSAFPTSGGVVTGSGLYERGANDTLYAVADSGYRFSHWSDGSTENPRIVTVQNDVSIIAFFDSLCTVINPGDTITVCDGYLFGYRWIDSSGVYSDTLTSAAGCDSVVFLNLTVNRPSFGDTSVIVCNGFFFDDQWLEYGGFYIDIFTNAVGCDSVVFLNLTVYNSSFGDTSVTACNNYFFGGQWIDVSGQYIDTLSNVMGCDSVVTLNLTINHPGHTAITESSCVSYMWNDSVYYETGEYSYSHLDGNGCTQVDTLHLTVNQPTTGTDVQTACDSYTWIDGITYTESNNTASYTLTNAAGCDSVVTLNLIVNYSTTGTDVQTACDSYTWIDGITYTESNNTASYTLTNAAGCDSVITLNLIVYHSTTGIEQQTACDSYTWLDGITYTQSNSTATYTLTNTVGCDSTVTLNLTINYGSTGIDQQTACDSYTWLDGVAYTQSNSTATYTLTNTAGCDSTVTLNLNINYSSTGIDQQTACDSYTWLDGITYTQSNSTATHTLTNTAGCDSTVTLNLTINYGSTGIDQQTACDSYTWLDGVAYTQSNSTATYTLTNTAGCDSTVTLNLNINYSSTGIDQQTACDSYTWLDGITYTQSNSTATYTLTNTVGCDSTITLNLTINYGSTGIEQQTACDSYTWLDGVAYTQSNSTATYTLTNTAGCDSTVTLNLNINYSSTGIDQQTACDSYTWLDGITYTQSNNSATYTLTNAAGCDSTVTLNLNINYSSTGIDLQTACDSYTWLDGITYTQSNSTATHTLTNTAGCDSTVTLYLIINYSSTGDTTATSCDNFVWWNTEYTNSMDSATRMLTNAFGCDSTVTLHLTVYYSKDTTISDTANGSYDWNGSNYTESGVYYWHGLTEEGCDSMVTLILVVNPVGIEQVEGDEWNVKVFPNPTTGWITIDADDVLMVETFDPTGRKVASCENTNRIDLSGLPKGDYLLRIQMKRGMSVMRVVLN